MAVRFRIARLIEATASQCSN
uniref:Uncharacterized protein n=1 Tax=Arundo donax TaxID=35708 RepID=A0A0A9F629_ARUDO